MTEKLKAKFGDLVENGWASERNPTRSGIFVREFRRPRGRMNAGLTWEITDGKGKFWELSPVGDHKITVTPSHDGADAVQAGGLADDVIRLVIAARLVAFGDIVMGADSDGWDALRELDNASEAFADRVPWDGQPEAVLQPGGGES